MSIFFHFLPFRDLTCFLSDLWGALLQMSMKMQAVNSQILMDTPDLYTQEGICEKRSKTLRDGYLMDTFQRNWKLFLHRKKKNNNKQNEVHMITDNCKRSSLNSASMPGVLVKCSPRQLGLWGRDLHSSVWDGA